MTLEFDLGLESDLVNLFSYPNLEPKQNTLPQTIVYWISQTLERDGFTAESGVSVRALPNGSSYTLRIEGPESVLEEMLPYGEYIPRFLEIGLDAWTGPIAKLKEPGGGWDPYPDPNEGPTWRFFLPWGMNMLRQNSLQFFHYPPIRLLDPYRDYLNDPVPYRWKQLLHFNGIADDDSVLDPYNRVIDGCPIGASDSQGAYMPIVDFPKYQEEMLKLFLEAGSQRPEDEAFTIPIIVFGIPAMAQFEHIFHANLDILVPQTVEILEGRKTPVLGATHPYHFYAQAQLGSAQTDRIGSGHLSDGCRLAEILMKQDLIAARWHKLMVDDPTQDPGALLNQCTEYWVQPERRATICQLVQHQGSLRTYGDNNLQFKYCVGLDDAATLCGRYSQDPCAARAAGSHPT